MISLLLFGCLVIRLLVGLFDWLVVCFDLCVSNRNHQGPYKPSQRAAAEPPGRRISPAASAFHRSSCQYSQSSQLLVPSPTPSPLAPAGRPSLATRGGDGRITKVPQRHLAPAGPVPAPRYRMCYGRHGLKNFVLSVILWPPRVCAPVWKRQASRYTMSVTESAFRDGA